MPALITSAGGSIDCTLDASQSSGFIASLGGATTSPRSPRLHVRSADDCTHLNGGVRATTSMLITLVLEDRAGSKGSASSTTVTLYTNGRCGY
jgi:hypothetical protein